MAELLLIALFTFFLAIIIDYISDSIKVDDTIESLRDMANNNAEEKAWLYSEVVLLEDGRAEKWGSLHKRLLKVRDKGDISCFYLLMDNKLITVYDRYDDYIRIEVSEVKL